MPLVGCHKDWSRSACGWRQQKQPNLECSCFLSTIYTKHMLDPPCERNGVFGSTFVELILDRIDFVGIDLVIIDFEVK